MSVNRLQQHCQYLLVTIASVLVLTGPGIDTTTISATTPLVATTTTTTTPSPMFRPTTNCDVWNNVITRLQNHPDMNLTCMTNVPCTGLGCKGRYTNQMHAIDYEICFGVTFRLCQAPVDVFVYFGFPAEHVEYERAFNRTSPPISLPTSPVGDIQSHIEVHMDTSVIQGVIYLNIKLSMLGQHTPTASWMPGLNMHIVDSLFTITSCNLQSTVPNHIPCDMIGMSTPTPDAGAGAGGTTRITTGLSPSSCNDNNPQGLCSVTTTVSPAKITRYIIIAVIVIIDVILMGLGVYLYLWYKRRQRAKARYEDAHPEEHERHHHHHHHHDSITVPPLDGDPMRRASLLQQTPHESPSYSDGTHHHHGSPHLSEHRGSHQSGGHHHHESSHHSEHHHHHGSPHHSGHHRHSEHHSHGSHTHSHHGSGHHEHHSRRGSQAAIYSGSQENGLHQSGSHGSLHHHHHHRSSSLTKEY